MSEQAEPRVLYVKHAGMPMWPQLITCYVETKVAWWNGHEWKHKDRAYKKSEWALITKEEYEDLKWLQHHQYGIAKAVERASSPAQLRQIAEIIRYDPEAK